MGDDLAQYPAGPAREPGSHGLSPGSVLLEQDFDEGSLYVLRAAVSAHGAETGLHRSRLYDLVTVAHELAANAVRHGAGRGHLRLWLDDGLLHCEVSDIGRAGDSAGSADGAQQVPWREEHGHGLWVVSRVADQFRIDRGATATTATAVFRLDTQPEPGQ
jgi:anti-sigma regulatory factor (Ser/Thr protein kinase)